MIEYFERPDGLGPVNGYSHAASGAGRLVAVSGQLPVDVHGALVDSSGGFAQARQVFANLGTALAAAGAGRQDLLRLTFFLTDLADLPAVREARDKFLGDGPPPAESAADARDRAGWLSPRDCAELVRAAVEGAVDDGFTVINGVSANRYRKAAYGRAERHLGFRPTDDAWTER